MTYSISSVQGGNYDQIIEWLIANRLHMFPMLPALDWDRVAEDFQQDFIDSEQGVFLLARDQDEKLIGTLGMKAYDYRFESLDYPQSAIVEVVKLFVSPTWRRTGLGSELFAQLETKARSAGVARLYLHTHRFLPGAIAFWEKNGFQTIWEQEGPLQTVHLDKSL